MVLVFFKKTGITYTVFNSEEKVASNIELLSYEKQIQKKISMLSFIIFTGISLS